MPAYRSTHSHPYQQNHMTFPHYYQPVMEGIPPQMKPPSVNEQAWPYIGGHNGYSAPMQCCCGHHRFPGYWTYTPAYPHIPASLPMCFSGGYPAYPEPSYVPYAPPPHYTMDLPKYEYDKCMPGEYHCCGCPNHLLSHKEGKGMKIEEDEPDSEKKVNVAVSPAQSKNYPYPFVWMPPQYMDNNEVGDDQRHRKPSEYASVDGREPKVWNGWFPLDINNLANMFQEGNGRKNKNENRQIDNGMRETRDGKMNQSQPSERNRREIPFPVIWIPDYYMQEGERMKDQERVFSPNSVREVPCALDAAPVVSRPSDDTSNRSNVNGNDLKVGDSDVTGEETNGKDIPVKQMELQRSEPESLEKKVRDIPVKQAEGDNPGKETQTSAKRQSSSPKKTSKLPPVCLRVDPLPKKKDGNGSSRSPSPSKKGSAASTNGTSKSPTCSNMHDKALADAEHQHSSNVGEELKPKEKTIEVVNISNEKKDGEQRDGSESHGKTQADVKFQKDSITAEDVKFDNKSIEVLEKSSEKKLEDHNCCSDYMNGEKIDGHEAERKVYDMIKEETTDAKDAKERKVLSDTEAAVLIQAAYRGSQVRKWEPLKKLKQIAEVSKQVIDVRGSIQALEASDDKQIDERERVTIGETIMRLLLKLDTIQGLHPNFREIRKSLARELNCLQEKLDSVIAQKSQLQEQEQPKEEVSKPEKDSSERIIQESHGSSEQQAEEIAASENSSGSIIHVTQDMTEQGQDQLSIKNGNPSHDDEKLQSVVHSSPVDDGNEKPEPLQEETANGALNKLSENEASGCDISEVQTKNKSGLEGIPNEADELDMRALEELPRGVIDDREADDVDFREDKEDEIEGEEQQISSVTSTSGDDEFAQDGESSKMPEMEELPIGLLDDDTTDSEKHEETGTSAQDPETVADDISKETQLDQLQQEHEEQEENQSNGESDDWVKVEYEKVELKGDALENANVEIVSREGNDDQSVTAIFTGNDGHGVANEDECLEVKEVTVTETPEEEVADKEAQSEQVIKDDAENKQGFSEKMDTDNKNLIEENEKLRKMMRKLLEAGNEQLTVISNLTGRVKDLEKKLAKKKRVKTVHCRPTTSKPSFKKSSNNQLQESIAGVAT